MDAKISVFVIGVEAIIYLLLYNLHDCTFKILATELFKINLSNNIMLQLICKKKQQNRLQPLFTNRVFVTTNGVE